MNDIREKHPTFMRDQSRVGQPSLHRREQGGFPKAELFHLCVVEWRQGMAISSLLKGSPVTSSPFLGILTSLDLKYNNHSQLAPQGQEGMLQAILGS